MRAPERGRGLPKGAPADEPDHHAIGRSRGGLSTKIHLVANGRCRPLRFVLTPGQAGDAPAVEHVMATRACPERSADRASGPSWSWRTGPLVESHPRAPAQAQHPVGDPAARGPDRQPQAQGPPRQPPAAFDREAYKWRNTVERCINRLKSWRGLATHYEKTATVFRAGLRIAGIFIWSAR
ncbi:transposase [Streptomyces sanglieri]|uniref:transposase n=1 Tax=Streptomyces sanglieri TaxID=193460 RepID=UPI003523A41F